MNRVRDQLMVRRFLISIPLLVLLCTASWVRNALYVDEPTIWRDVITKTPNKSRVYNNLGAGLLNTGKLPEAAIAYERAILLDPRNTDAVYGLAVAYYGMGRNREALSLYERTLALDPGRRAAKRNVAMMYYESGQRDKARREYESIIQMFPYSEEAVFARKMLLMIGH